MDVGESQRRFSETRFGVDLLSRIFKSGVENDV